MTGPRVRLLALDVDDTLTGKDGRISQANLDALRLARERGIAVTIVTGRRYLGSSEDFANQLGITGFIGCHYGRAVVHHPSGEVVAAAPMSTGVCLRVLDYAASHGLMASFAAAERYFFPLEAAPLFEGRAGPPLEFVPDLREALRVHDGGVMGVTLSGEDAGGVQAHLAAEVSSGAVHVHNQHTAGRGMNLAVVLDGRLDKGRALIEICRRMGLSPAETLAMGDSEADIPLLRAAGIGVAMPWSDELVRRAATRVAEGDGEDAVAREVHALLRTM